MLNSQTSSTNRVKVLGYGICGPNEKYLDATLEEFSRLCDHTVICLNGADDETEQKIRDRKFDVKRDAREWGTSQHLIKEDFVASLIKYNPEWLICLDMDERFDPSFTREEFDRISELCDSMYVYVVNLWDDGWNRPLSFWNIRAWKWNGMTKFVNRPLHCGLAPEWAYHYGSHVPVALLHYGLKDSADRARKVERYKKYDPKAKYLSRSFYDSLEKDTATPMDIEKIREAIHKEVPKIHRKHAMDAYRKKYVYVKRKDGKILDIPAESLNDHLKRGFVLVS